MAKIIKVRENTFINMLKNTISKKKCWTNHFFLQTTLNFTVDVP